MQLNHLPAAPHLMYCTNIHAAENWGEISASLDEHLPLIKQELKSSSTLIEPFALGLRLSAIAANELSQPEHLEELKSQLSRLNAYVPSINAFPYGGFHTAPIKQLVYQPDWLTTKRQTYTLQCAQILAQLLPDGVSGSISTVPGAFKSQPWHVENNLHIAHHLIEVAAGLVKLERGSGKLIALALEPEPCCMLETVAETIHFFQNFLFSPEAVSTFAKLIGVNRSDAEALLRRHIGVCYDVCHAAVEFENPVDALQSLQAAGIGIPKIQLSCALRIPQMLAELHPAVMRFNDGVYLHQVVVSQQGKLQRFTDLPEALSAFEQGTADGEWRIHCHVPVFLSQLDLFESTQAELLAVLQALRSNTFSAHLEIETYTWDVLPAAFKTESKATAIAREIAFIMKEIAL
ncbi:metabolite traffic protein EboE [Solimicrobium silvestre]|uniref:Xylose isomerase-like TIM barrel n=1 Tax=Solimicrobium silvestre TaxID=2099400 RepID=A0A2S9H0E3_9BURK|nr:metabolite traffic protein EboE [Solimicrobium silvestre]PRC93428.1 hypothetical protein S2091_1815 [Solimicrobium silvestre]